MPLFPSNFSGVWTCPVCENLCFICIEHITLIVTVIWPPSAGDDDRPEIIELSDFNPAEPQFKLCSRVSSEHEYESQDYSERQYREFPSSEYTQEYAVGEYQQDCSNDYGHEHDYHQLHFPETNLSEGDGFNNEDSVSEVNLSDGNIPKMKLDEVRHLGSDKTGRWCCRSVKNGATLNTVYFLTW